MRLSLVCLSVPLMSWAPPGADCKECPSATWASEAFMKQFLAQLSPENFFDKFWGKRPVVLRGHAFNRDYSHIFRLADLKDVVLANSTSANRLRKGSFVEFGDHLNLKRWDSSVEMKLGDMPKHGMPADPILDSLNEMFKDGWTMVFSKIQKFWRPALRFISAFEQYLEMPMNGNIYVTPQGCDGLTMHWDPHPSFFVQISGCKHWRVWDAFVEGMAIKDKDPQRTIKTHPGSIAERLLWQRMQRLIVNETLQPGDVLYIPRGFLHEGTVPQNEPASVHITVGAVDGGLIWADLLKETPFLQVSGQPFPGVKREPSVARYTPQKDFEKLVTKGLPLALRGDLPPRLTHMCRETRFPKLVIEKLHSLNPDVTRKQLSSRFSQLSSEAIGLFCSSFLLTQIGVFLSDEQAQVHEGEINLDTALCVSSPIAARVKAPWQKTAPALKNEESSTVLFYSSANGPARVRQMPQSFPGWISSAMKHLLHMEINTGGRLRARDFLVDAGGDVEKKEGVLAYVRKLISMRVLHLASEATLSNDMGAPHSSVSKSQSHRKVDL